MTSREGPSTSSSVICEENDDGAIAARWKRDSNRVYFGAPWIASLAYSRISSSHPMLW